MCSSDLFFATGNTSYLEDVSKRYELAKTEEKPFDKGIFYWNNKLTANAVILLSKSFMKNLEDDI